MTNPSLSGEERTTLIAAARLLQQNQAKEAETLLEPLYVRYSDDADVAGNLGGAYILQRKWEKAVDVLSAATEAHPDNAMLWTNLAAAELGSLETAGPQHQERAIAAYTRALEADPATPNAHYHLGLIHKERGELDAAEAMFQRALEINPGDRDAAHWLQRIQQVRGQQSEHNA
ncbi:MAG: tetratricopeptide repeat protein [Caldilineaceae bacterium]|nr:tetratricopeptide repeat protein [Caldilineaceae bacterium]